MGVVLYLLIARLLLGRTFSRSASFLASCYLAGQTIHKLNVLSEVHQELVVPVQYVDVRS